MAAKNLTLKLLIDKTSQKVLFAEVNKDVVDFLFSLLSIPIGSIVKLFSAKSMSMVGCVGNIHQSVENLDKRYIQPNKDLSVLLNPPIPTLSYSPNVLLLSSTPKVCYYRCPSNINHSCLTDVCGTQCPSCGSQMTTDAKFVGPNSGKVEANAGGGEGEGRDGFVKGVVTYTVIDDLSIVPMSTISSIMAVNSLNVKDLTSLQEKTVTLGLQEGLEILLASLHSKTVLTDVFVGKGRVCL